MLVRAGLLLSLGVLGSASLAGCGASSGDASAMTGGSTATGGASTGGNSTGGGSATGGTTGATGGATGTPIDPPTALPTTTCTSKQVLYQGTVGGTAIDETLTLPSTPVGIITPIGYDKGVEILEITETLEGQLRRVSGVLVLPTGSAKAGEVWCVDNGLRGLTTNGAYSYTGHSLGKCPGSPTNETVYACSDYATAHCDPSGPVEDRPLAGTLSGKEITLGTEGGSIQTSGTVHAKSASGYDMVFFANSPAPTNGSTTVTGYIVGLEGSPHEGEVYCVDGGTWSTNGDYSKDSFVLNQVSFLGSCKSGVATEKLEGCFGY